MMQLFCFSDFNRYIVNKSFCGIRYSYNYKFLLVFVESTTPIKDVKKICNYFWEPLSVFVYDLHSLKAESFCCLNLS